MNINLNNVYNYKITALLKISKLSGLSLLLKWDNLSSEIFIKYKFNFAVTFK